MAGLLKTQLYVQSSLRLAFGSAHYRTTCGNNRQMCLFQVYAEAIAGCWWLQLCSCYQSEGLVDCCGSERLCFTPGEVLLVVYKCLFLLLRASFFQEVDIK